MFFLKELPTAQMIQGYADKSVMENVGAVQSALFMMRQASLLVREIESYFAKQNTSQLRFLIMIVIDREPKRHSLLASEISDRIDVSRPVMTRTLQSMAAENLVKVKPDVSDKRAKQVELTVHGKQFLDKILPEYFAIICRFMATSNP